MQGVIVEGTHTADPRLAGARRRAWRTSVGAARGSTHGLSQARTPAVAISSCSAPVGCVPEIRAAYGPAQLTRVHLLGRGRVGGMGGVSPGGVICSGREVDTLLSIFLNLLYNENETKSKIKERCQSPSRPSPEGVVVRQCDGEEEQHPRASREREQEELDGGVAAHGASDERRGPPGELQPPARSYGARILARRRPQGARTSPQLGVLREESDGCSS